MRNGLWRSLPAFRTVVLLPVAEKPVLDFVVNASKPVFRLERLLLELLHLFLELCSAVFGRAKLHRKLMSCLRCVLDVCFGGLGRLVQ